MIPAAKPIIGDDEREAVDRVLRSGMLAQGPEVKAFEDEFSPFVGNRHCIAVNSGTSALHMAFVAAGIRQGDEVIVPSFSFAATANSVKLAGATPVFADVEADYFNLDPKSVEAAITPRTRAIMPVHLYGHPAAMHELQAICQRHNLVLFEDAAQAHLAELDGTPVGAFGAAASFSFYPTKNMTSGEGGKIEGWTKTRQQNAKFLSDNLKGVVTPPVAAGATHVYHQYTIRVVDHNRDAFAEELTKRGVGNGVYYPTPIHRLPSFGLTLDLPVTEQVAQQCLSLPVHPSLSQSDLETIVSTVNSVAQAGS